MPAYNLLYVGGLRRQPRHRITRQSRQIVYTSPLPNLLGCVRGFMVGNHRLELRSANKSGSKLDHKFCPKREIILLALQMSKTVAISDVATMKFDANTKDTAK